jgi:hypothetical protein
MDDLFLVTINSEADRSNINEIVEKIVAEYPDTLIVECTPQQYADLVEAKIECERKG